MEARLLPVRLQLEQGTVAFLQRFFMPFLRESSLEEPAVLVEHTDVLATDLGEWRWFWQSATRKRLPKIGLGQAQLGNLQGDRYP